MTIPSLRTRIGFAALAIAAAISFADAPAFAAAKPRAGTFQVEEATIADIHEAILAKKLTTTELLTKYLKRIKAYNGPGVEEPEGLLGPIKLIPNATGINALSTLNLRPATRKAWGFDERKARSMTDLVDDDPNMPDAFEVAAKLDEHFAKTGKLIGPLHGVVMSIKDQYDTFDMRSTSGGDAFYANDRPPADAEHIARLRKAGAIILAKANLSEYADGTPRSSFGGTTVNPYDTERNPFQSSAGSATSVTTSMVTVAIAEETGPSIRGPAHANNCIGISPTQELVSRHGMIQSGMNTRTGPIARTVEDAARVLTVIAGYDPKDPLTAFTRGRLPDKPYESFTHEKSLEGMRIGVVREYMDKDLFTKADEQNIDIVNRAIKELEKLGAEIVDPGAHGELFTKYVMSYYPMLHDKTFTALYPEMFPVDAAGKPTGDHITTLIDLAMDPSKAPKKLTIRDINSSSDTGESRFQTNLYLRRRGDANIKSQTDLYTKANFHVDLPFLRNRKSRLESRDKDMALDMAARMQFRFAVQQIVFAAFAEMNLDAVVYPTNNLPAPKIGAPTEPNKNGRGSVWSFLGRQGFPAMTVPVGFTTHVYDRILDPAAPPPALDASNNDVASIVVGPTPAKLPVAMDLVGLPFSEPVLLKIAAAFEKATNHRQPPPNFGPLDSDT